MNAPYHPPYLRETRSLSIQAFEFFCLCVIFGSLLFLSFAGAVLFEPPVIP